MVARVGVGEAGGDELTCSRMHRATEGFELAGLVLVLACEEQSDSQDAHIHKGLVLIRSRLLSTRPPAWRGTPSAAV
jgi:hypothetical protein